MFGEQKGLRIAMEWRAEALVMGVRPHGESSVVLEVMTADHGRHLGLVKGGRSARQQPTLQPGNVVEVNWRARLDAHLGHFTVDLKAARAARLMESAVGLFGLQVVTAHLRYLPERDPHAGLYEAAGVVLDHLGDPVGGAHLIARFELALLDELGFGLDLSVCAATGSRQDLVYVSPKSGRAVSGEAGAPYRDRLLALPPFLRPDPPTDRPGRDAVLAALRLTGYFLDRHVADPRGVPLAPARGQLLDRLAALPAG